MNNEKQLDSNFNAGLIQNDDIVYELVPVGYVASGLFRKAPDAPGKVLAEWDGKRVATAPLYTVPICKMEPANG